MKYITHHRFKELALCGEQLNIPYGTELGTNGCAIVMPDGRPVCYTTSENAQKHFSRNNDGKGLERGKLTYAIAYGNRNMGNGFRFSEDETKILKRNWGHFLREDVDVILFNDDFFAAEPEELQRLADALKSNRDRRKKSCI